MPLLGVATWLGCLVGQLTPWWVLVGVAAAAGLAVARWSRAGIRRTAVGLVLLAVAAGAVTMLRIEAVSQSPVAALADEGAVVTVTGHVVSDPRVVHGQFADQVVTRLQVREVTGRGRTYALRSSLVVLGDESWSAVELGASVRTLGRLVPADDASVAGLMTGARDPVEVTEPSIWWRGADEVREGIRAAVAHRPAEQRALVPALVDGDDAGLDPALVADFRTTGLTHLTAVSGTNLTLVVGFLVLLARWCGVRGRWLYLVGGVGVVGFILLARTEPSVVRAAAMGTVGLLAMGWGGRDRAWRALGVAVVVLLLADPQLAVSVGFALSALATAGIVGLAPGMRDALRRWLPTGVAEAIAVPFAAQLACTPIVAAISGQVSLVAVLANLAVAPVVGPATVLGLIGGLVSLVAEAPARLCGTGAGWCVAWIVWVARHGADLPTAAIGWGTGAVALTVLVLLTVVIALLAPFLLRHPATGISLTVVLILVLTVRLPTPGWPPDGWLLAACDVGQGDALVINTGPGEGILVDAGPEPAAVDRCLDLLEIRALPLVVLTHFHADHIDGLAGVMPGRPVAELWTTRVLDPPEGVAEVESISRSAGITPQAPSEGLIRVVGRATVQVLWPRAGDFDPGPGDGTAANDASLVLLVEVAGVRLLLTGDIEPPAQTSLATSLAGLDVDVLKVPHHGSRYQDLSFLESLDPEVALVSVGADNDYGHPAASTLDPLVAAGAEVYRTDQDGMVVVSGDSGALQVRTRDP